MGGTQGMVRKELRRAPRLHILSKGPRVSRYATEIDKTPFATLRRSHRKVLFLDSFQLKLHWRLCLLLFRYVPNVAKEEL